MRVLSAHPLCAAAKNARRPLLASSPKNAQSPIWNARAFFERSIFALLLTVAHS